MQEASWRLEGSMSVVPSGFECADCDMDTSEEYYMVHDILWDSITHDRYIMLCILCLERRLGRRLNAGDFTDAIVNDLALPWTKSTTLIDRLTSTP